MTKATRNKTTSGKQAAGQRGDSDRGASSTSDDSADGIKRFRKVIILVLAFVVVVVLVFSLLSALDKHRTENLTARFYSVFTKPVYDGEEPDMEAVDSVLAEARGRPQEEWFLRVTVEYLLKHADEQDASERREARNDSAAADTSTESDSTISAEAARAKARAIVEEARERIGDPDVLDWASSVLARLDGLNSDGWRPPPRVYRLPPPPQGEDESSTSSPSTEEATGEGAGTERKTPSEADDAASDDPDPGAE